MASRVRLDARSDPQAAAVGRDHVDDRSAQQDHVSVRRLARVQPPEAGASDLARNRNRASGALRPRLRRFQAADGSGRRSDCEQRSGHLCRASVSRWRGALVGLSPDDVGAVVDHVQLRHLSLSRRRQSGTRAR